MALITTTSDIPINLQGFYDRALLENAKPALLYDRFGQTRPLPKNKGDRINFRRYGKLAVNLNPLAEGTTPTGKKLSVTDLYATIKQYGDYVMLSDWIQMVGLDPNVMDIAENLLSQQLAETKDTLARDVLVAGTTVRYGNGVAARTSIVTAILDDDVASAVRTLEGNDAKKINKIIVAGNGVNTSPINASFIGITHTHARYDIEGLKGFVPVNEYASRDSLASENGEIIEIGSTPGIRWFATTNAKIWADSGGSVGTTGLVSTSASLIDTYASLILARNAYGTVPLQKETVKMIAKQLGSAGTEDPLDQRATVGHKFATTTRILNDDWMVRIEHGVTSL